ncbi:MAG: hypothetical protein FRX48_00532 [Lasallia pustulata]|uniref:STB6-like N-terminal domain-containing protein n=1 Tax=Lasallia pustulata TaxID=136370 RepID=A0A5M8Q0X2_9LECA|nr:MAG: hypothetical protein FRX48_00532 [Lasallia pustulata]
MATGDVFSLEAEPDLTQWVDSTRPRIIKDRPEPVTINSVAPHSPSSPSAYLEEDTSTTVLERRRRLQGYELYIVEQWACSRVHPTFVITTYTGFPQHSVVVGVLSVPTDEEAWSPRLRVYFKAVAQFHARKKETALGTLMVTNLSGFPSALTVIAVPEGDVKKHREDFIVNENLKRLGCSGRAGLNLSPPIGATQAKFLQLYRTSDKVPLYSAVFELVKLCQVALVLFAKLAPEYADGLLCDVTERAINDWWTEVGTEFFNMEPNDGILGPTTVAALLGMLMGARNRLNAYGAPVGKDVFDLGPTKRGIAYFQKSQKLNRTRRLDRQTLDRLHRATAKAASGEGWTVPKAVKSTVAELSGKGGEMVMGMVGAREKAGIAEVESLDIDTFIHLASGERSKWLWHGKPRKSNDGDIFSNLTGEEVMEFGRDEHGGYIWSGKKRDPIADELGSRYEAPENIYMHSSHGSQASIDAGEKDQALRRTVLKSVTGRMNDARSGLGRIKDAVGITGLRAHHHHKYSKDGGFVSDGDSFRGQDHGDNSSQIALFQEASSQPNASVADLRNQADKADHSQAANSDDRDVSLKSVRSSFLQPALAARGSAESISSGTPAQRTGSSEDTTHITSFKGAKPISDAAKSAQPDSILGRLDPLTQRKHEVAIGEDVERFDECFMSLSLRRLRSVPQLPSQPGEVYAESRWPRHLSFSVVDDVLMVREDEHEEATGTNGLTDPHLALVWEEFRASATGSKGERLLDLRKQDGLWVDHIIGDVEGLDAQAGRDQGDLNSMYHQKMDEYHALRGASNDLLAEEKTSLTEAIKDVEVLGAKLEYELSALQSKVEDVEDGVEEFERQVQEIELRAQELEDEKTAKDSWLWWFLKAFHRRQ